jgi:anti-sigma regulatory factor (Ser/Thr protein kinase)
MGALPTAAGSARVHVRVTLASWGLDDIKDVAELVVSELVANAIRASTAPGGAPAYRHGRMLTLQVGVFSDRQTLRIEVFDQAPGRPVMRQATADMETGRGLALVDTFTAGNWGWQPCPGGGKVVWAECASSAARDAAA